ncbi:MAG: ribonuclease P protein component [Kofleriaceae bacterium]
MAARTSSRPNAIEKSMRLRRRPEFLVVQAQGRKLHGTGFLALVARTPAGAGASVDQAPGRVGFTVTKRIGNAVIRNRIRRRAREWLRQHGWAPAGRDVVLIAKEAAATMTSAAIGVDLQRLWGKVAAC